MAQTVLAPGSQGRVVPGPGRPQSHPCRALMAGMHAPLITGVCRRQAQAELVLGYRRAATVAGACVWGSADGTGPWAGRWAPPGRTKGPGYAC